MISLNGNGTVRNFVMNEKCAAGTGRSLEVLARSIRVGLEDLGPLSLKSWRPVSISNKCSIFMELEVLQHLYAKRNVKDIACGINDAVARRVAALARSMEIREKIAITGGVSKNRGVMRFLEEMMEIRFTPLTADPQIAGALGAAVFAGAEARRMRDSELVS